MKAVKRTYRYIYITVVICLDFAYKKKLQDWTVLIITMI
jgi:hypothetical protein